MKTVCLIFVLLLCSCKSTGVILKDINAIDKQQKWGITLYERGDYQGAFQELSELAPWGYKDSQYALAFMFLKGLHVEQSTLIGMGWLGVAAESGIKEWQQLFDELYHAASAEDKTNIDLVVNDYIAKFGLKAQHVVCQRTKRGFSKRIVMQCTKNERLTTVHSIDLKESDVVVLK